MKNRIYYWLRGAPANRPGGPWWYHDFGGDEQGDGEMDRFVTDILPFCRTMRCLSAEELPVHDPMQIEPPKGARWVCNCVHAPEQHDAHVEGCNTYGCDCQCY